MQAFVETVLLGFLAVSRERLGPINTVGFLKVALLAFSDEWLVEQVVESPLFSDGLNPVHILTAYDVSSSLVSSLLSSFNRPPDGTLSAFDSSAFISVSMIMITLFTSRQGNCRVAIQNVLTRFKTHCQIFN